MKYAQRPGRCAPATPQNKRVAKMPDPAGARHFIAGAGVTSKVTFLSVDLACHPQPCIAVIQ
jgi:hypothetical protein